MPHFMRLRQHDVNYNPDLGGGAGSCESPQCVVGALPGCACGTWQPCSLCWGGNLMCVCRCLQYACVCLYTHGENQALLPRAALKPEVHCGGRGRVQMCISPWTSQADP